MIGETGIEVGLVALGATEGQAMMTAGLHRRTGVDDVGLRASIERHACCPDSTLKLFPWKLTRKRAGSGNTLAVAASMT